MKSPLKGANGLEKIGFILIVFSLLFMLTYRQFEGVAIATFMEKHELVFWVGLLIWAFGYLMRSRTAKIKNPVAQDD